MPDLNDQLRRYIDGLEEPVSVEETMGRRSERRFRVPAAVLAGAAIVLVPALVLVGLRWAPGDGRVSATTVSPETTTTSAPENNATTATSIEAATTSQPAVVVVPDLTGLSEADATALLANLPLTLEVTEQYASRSGFGLITAQYPAAGEEATAGSTISVGIRVEASCLGYQSEVAASESTTVQVLYECAGDGFYPDISTPLTRVVAPGDPIEATLRELLAGPSDEERAMGFSSFFSTESADALASIALDGSRLTVDFNDAILIGNASTSTGGMYFLAELQANLFQFPEVDSIEFRLNGSCDDFFMWLQYGCETLTRAQWEQTVAAWDAERRLQPVPGDELAIEDVAGKTFTTESGDGSQRIMVLDGSDVLATGFTEAGGWLVDDPSTDSETWRNWALQVTGLNAEMIWLVNSTDRTDDGSMIYSVRAVLVIPWDEIMPALTGDPILIDGFEGCAVQGESDPTVVVAGQVTVTGVERGAVEPVRAWRIDVADGAFDEIPLDGVECMLESG